MRNNANSFSLARRTGQ